MTFINEAFAYPTVAALKATPSNLLKDGLFYPVRDADGAGIPAWFQYQSDSTLVVNEPAVIDPTNAGGRLIAMGGLSSGGGGGGGGAAAQTGTNNPIGNVTPAAAGEIYVWDSVESGVTKTVAFVSTGVTSADWEAYAGSAVVFLDVSLTGGADYIGQIAYVLSSGSTSPSLSESYVAYQVGNGSSDWTQTF